MFYNDEFIDFEHFCLEHRPHIRVCCTHAFCLAQLDAILKPGRGVSRVGIISIQIGTGAQIDLSSMILDQIVSLRKAKKKGFSLFPTHI